MRAWNTSSMGQKDKPRSMNGEGFTGQSIYIFLRFFDSNCRLQLEHIPRAFHAYIVILYVLRRVSLGHSSISLADSQGLSCLHIVILYVFKCPIPWEIPPLDSQASNAMSLQILVSVFALAYSEIQAIYTCISLLDTVMLLNLTEHKLPLVLKLKVGRNSATHCMHSPL